VKLLKSVVTSHQTELTFGGSRFVLRPYIVSDPRAGGPRPDRACVARYRAGVLLGRAAAGLVQRRWDDPPLRLGPRSGRLGPPRAFRDGLGSGVLHRRRRIASAGNDQVVRHCDTIGSPGNQRRASGVQRPALDKVPSASSGSPDVDSGFRVAGDSKHSSEPCYRPGAKLSGGLGRAA
jgi:hypothetical protein